MLSIGIFFTLMIIGLAGDAAGELSRGRLQQGVPPDVAARVARLPPVSTLFAAFLGYNPMQHLLGPATLAHLAPEHAALLTGRRFFPELIAPPFTSGLHTAFDFAIVACLVAAAASWSRGGRYVHQQESADRREPGAGDGDHTSATLRRGAGR